MAEFETVCVHTGNEESRDSNAVAVSPIFSTTFRQSGGDGAYVYSRLGAPTRTRLEQLLARLEGGAQALCFASGMAAVAAVLQYFQTQPHGALLLPRECYHGDRHLAKLMFVDEAAAARLHYVDMHDAAAVDAAVARCGGQAQLLWIETPANPTLRVSDIAALAAAGRRAGALVVVDNTWATPVLCRPLQLGAHVVLHSTTKYLGGHCDLLGGALVFGADCPPPVYAHMHSWQSLGGAVPSAFDCWLLLRSAATLPVRVRSQSATAATLARWLASHPRVQRVHYPGLPSHPAHDVAMRQMSGCGGAMLAIEVVGGFDAARAVVARVRLWVPATSLGGVESLIEHRKPIEGPDSPTPDALLRLSVGLEHVDDLRRDLDQALGAAARL